MANSPLIERHKAGLLGAAMLVAGFSALVMLVLKAKLPTGFEIPPQIASLYAVVGFGLVVMSATRRGYAPATKGLFYAFGLLAITGIVTGSGSPGITAGSSGYWLTYSHALVAMASAAIGWPVGRIDSERNATLPTFGEYQDNDNRPGQ